MWHYTRVWLTDRHIVGWNFMGKTYVNYTDGFRKGEKVWRKKKQSVCALISEWMWMYTHMISVIHTTHRNAATFPYTWNLQMLPYNSQVKQWFPIPSSGPHPPWTACVSVSAFNVDTMHRISVCIIISIINRDCCKSTTSATLLIPSVLCQLLSRTFSPGFYSKPTT